MSESEMNRIFAKLLLMEQLFDSLLWGNDTEKLTKVDPKLTLGQLNKGPGSKANVCCPGSKANVCWFCPDPKFESKHFEWFVGCPNRRGTGFLQSYF